MLVNRRSVIERLDRSLIISAPSRKSVSLIVFLISFSGLWIMGEKVIISLILSIASLEGYNYFFLLWFVIWTSLGFLLFVKLVWLLAGKEVVTLSSDILMIEKVYPGVRKSREYHLHGIKDLRIEEPLFFRNQRGLLSSFFFKGFIKFDYGVKTIAFMNSVEKEEAAYILEQINDYLHKK